MVERVVVDCGRDQGSRVEMALLSAEFGGARADTCQTNSTQLHGLNPTAHLNRTPSPPARRAQQTTFACLTLTPVGAAPCLLCSGPTPSTRPDIAQPSTNAPLKSSHDAAAVEPDEAIFPAPRHDNLCSYLLGEHEPTFRSRVLGCGPPADCSCLELS